jgi:hypothetical protein
MPVAANTTSATAGAIGVVGWFVARSPSHIDDALSTSEVNVGWREVVEALVVAAVIVVVDEVGDRTLQLTRKVFLGQDFALQ